MGLFQFILTFTAAIPFTLGLFYLFQSIFIYKKINHYFYFATLSFSSFLYILSQLLLSLPDFTPFSYLVFHKLKLFASFGCSFSILFLCFLIFMNSDKIPKLYLYVGAAITFFIPFDIFLSLPIEHLSVKELGMTFDYRFGKTHVLYTLYSINLLIFLSITFIQLIKAKLTLKRKFYAFIMGLSVLAPSANDFAVAHRFYNSIMLNEFTIFIFISILFIFFINQGRQDYQKLENTNEVLEKEVKKRTRELQKTHQELQGKTRQMIDDLEVAKRLQLSMIPGEQTLPEKQEVSFGGKYSSMDLLGGDFYDVIELSHNRYGIYIADVLGHGVPAALITSMVKISFNSNSKKESCPAVICEKVNQEVYNCIGDLNFFVTAFYAILDLNSNTITFSSAGHHPSLLLKKSSNEMVELKTKGNILGIFEHSQYEPQTISIEKGDKILFYTDGIIETRNKDGFLYGKDRLLDFFYQSHSLSSKDFVSELFLDIHKFSGDSPATDDRALLYIKLMD